MPMGFVGRMAARTAIARVADELAERLADQTEVAIETAVRLRARSLAAGVEVERLLYPDLADDLFLVHLVRRRAKLSGLVGAITAVPSTFPGAGTAVALGSSLADSAAMLYSEVALIVELCAATGRAVDDPEVLTVDVLVVLASSAGVEVSEELLAEAQARSAAAERDSTFDACGPQPRARRAGGQAHRTPPSPPDPRPRAAVRVRRGPRRRCQLPDRCTRSVERRPRTCSR